MSTSLSFHRDPYAHLRMLDMNLRPYNPNPVGARYKRIRCSACNKVYNLAIAKRCTNLIYVTIDDEYIPCRGYYCPFCQKTHREAVNDYCSSWNVRNTTFAKSTKEDHLQ